MKLVIRDYTNYEPNRSRNGGAYGYEERAHITADGKIIDGEYWTTSEFPYCQYCGSFQQRLNEHIDRFHGGEDEAEYKPSGEMDRAIGLIIQHGPERH